MKDAGVLRTYPARTRSAVWRWCWLKSRKMSCAHEPNAGLYESSRRRRVSSGTLPCILKSSPSGRSPGKVSEMLAPFCSNSPGGSLSRGMMRSRAARTMSLIFSSELNSPCRLEQGGVVTHEKGPYQYMLYKNEHTSLLPSQLPT